mgnify:CR=1 FL=1
MRPTIYHTYATIVTALGERSTCSARAKVGALLYDNEYRIISSGYNGSPFGFDHCDDVGCNLDKNGHCQNVIHAEENALLQCAVVGRSTRGLRLFTTHSPCWRCMLRLTQAEIAEVVYMLPYGSLVSEVIWEFTKHHISISQFIGEK